jgi:hypothetical protein
MTPLEEAHQLFDLEKQHLERFAAEDPTFARLVKLSLRAHQEIERRLGEQYSTAVSELYQDSLEVMAEMMFKLGYVFAKSYPVDEVLASG